ncbi:helicase [Aureococcus anophagefferens]|nr:helicase [Aureococcus anophagefferens]
MASKPAPAKSAYGFFTKSRHEWYSANDKSKPMGDRMKEISAAWKALDAGGKKKFDKLAEQDRARFERESDEADAAAAAEQEAKRAQRDGDATGPRGCKRSLEEKAAKPRKKVEMSAARKKQIAADRAEREQREENIEEEREALRERMAEAAQARLKYLLSQSDIFGHFGSGVTAAAKAASRGRDGGAAASPRTPKSPSKRRARVDSAGDDDDDGAAARLEGLNWMIRLQEHGMNGILADEMGLGKTLQSISVLGWLAEAKGVKGPHLVLVPKSTLGNWMNEFARWCPEMLKAVRFHGSKPEREAFVRDVLKPGCAPGERDWDVCVTTYEVANAEARALEKLSWRFVIIDEAHRIKNEASLFARTARSLRAERRLLVTGTPLQNNLHELWALLNFLLPDVFASSDQFDEWFDLDVEDEDAKKTMITQLHKLLRPFVLRRLKVDVEKSLPPKTETILFTGLSVSQKQVYKSLLKRDASLLAGPEAGGDRAGASRAKMANIAMQLRKCCNHPYLFQGVEDRNLDPLGDHVVANCGKLVLLDKLLAKLKDRGHRVLVFSQMTALLDVLEDFMAMRDYEYCRIDGNTSYEERDDLIEAYNAPNSDKFVFLLSTRAGGLGINLQTADTVVLYDSDWNPQADLQAMDRAHRIGQKKPVHVYRLVTANTIEEKIVERAKKKLKLDAMVVQQGRLNNAKKELQGPSKDEMLEAVTFGASAIFRSGDSNDVTDDDIDAIIARGAERTALLDEKLAEADQGDMLDFKLDGDSNMQTFEGVDYSDKSNRTQTDEEALIAAAKADADALAKRDRPRSLYNVQALERAFKPKPKGEPSRNVVPAARRLPKLDAHMFCDGDRLRELGALEEERYRALYVANDGDAYAAACDAGVLGPELEAEKAALLAAGFPAWNKQRFRDWYRCVSRLGRENHGAVAEALGVDAAEVARYSAAFWARGALEIDEAEYQKALKSIERGEKELEKNTATAAALDRLVAPGAGGGNLLETLPVDTQGQALKEDHDRPFSREEDRFLLVASHALGGPGADGHALAAAARASDRFLFDRFFLSQSPGDLAKRAGDLAKKAESILAEVERRERGEADRKSKKASSERPSGVVLAELRALDPDLAAAAQAASLAEDVEKRGKALLAQRKDPRARRDRPRPPGAAGADHATIIDDCLKLLERKWDAESASNKQAYDDKLAKKPRPAPTVVSVPPPANAVPSSASPKIPKKRKASEENAVPPDAPSAEA